MKEKRILEILINILLDLLIVIFGIILLFSIYNGAQTKIFGNDYSSLFGYSVFEVQSGSMRDKIDIGDWIIVKYSTDIKLDDIITYKKDDNYITHRVVEEYVDTYVTKGDANNTKDEAISKSQVVGKVVKILPNFGIFKKTLFNPIVLVTLIITLYLFSYAFRSIKNSKDEVNTNKNTRSKIDALITKLLDKLMSLKDNKTETKKKNVLEVVEERTIESNSSFEENNDEEVLEDDIDDEIEITPMDMEQTRFFRMVSVNKGDVDGVYNKKNIKKSEIIIEDSNISEEEIESKTEAEVKKCVSELQSKKKKFKNIIDKIMYIKEDEINSIINVLNRKEKFKTNESTINDSFLKTYIYARYYGLCDGENLEYNSKNMNSKINELIKSKATQMISQYKGSDKLYEEKVDKYIKFYMLINILESYNIQYKDITSKRENYKSKILPVLKNELTSGLELMDIVNKIIIIQKVHSKILNSSLEKLNSNTFSLQVESIDKNMYAVNLKHNINFSKVYSDYIVDKTYSEGVIAEDKTMIMITMLISIIVNDMLNSNFKNKYFIHVPSSIYEKRNKLDRIFDMFDDDRGRESIIIVNDYNDIIKNKKVIKELKKSGYHFAIAFNKETVINNKDASNLVLGEYLIAKNEVVEKIKLIEFIPEELKNKIVNDDAYLKIID
ncbi:MAG: signal peptidase I [bacterium]|nr:signal peptidase I [bacterium]